MAAPSNARFVLYISDPRTPGDEQALAACQGGPALLNEVIRVVVVSGHNTPFLEDTLNKARTNTPAQTLEELAKLIASAHRRAQTTTTTPPTLAPSGPSRQEIERAQAERRAALLARTGLGGAGAPQFQTPQPQLQTPQPQFQAQSQPQPQYKQPPAEAAAAAAEAALLVNTFRPSWNGLPAQYGKMGVPIESMFESALDAPPHVKAEKERRAQQSLDAQFGASPRQPGYVSGTPIVGSSDSGEVPDADSILKRREAQEAAARAEHERRRAIAARSGQPAAIVPEVDGKARPGASSGPFSS